MSEGIVTTIENDNLSEESQKSAKTITIVVYALQAASILLGFTFIVAIIINYIKKSDVKGTWLESHFKWQIRTFWFSLLWVIIGVIAAYFVIGYFILVANTIWVIYRIVKGWLRLNDEKEMYVTT